MKGCNFTADVIDRGAALTERGLIQFPPNEPVINICICFLNYFLNVLILYNSRPVSALTCDKCNYM